MGLPTYCARNGQQGQPRWYVDVEEFSERIPVLHHTLLGPGGQPWPHQFLRGDRYDQKCNSRSTEKADQAHRLAQIGLVVMTRDFWSDPPGVDRPTTIRIRIQGDGYVGLFRCIDPRFSGGHLTFQLGAQLCHLVRPSDYRARA
jgi:hypothetical protein